MSAASSAQITFIKNLLADHIHTDNGKTITVDEARFRTTADKIDSISSAVASRMITALKAAPMKPVEERTPEGPHFRNLGPFGWKIAGVVDGKRGDIIEIRTKAGKTRTVRLISRGGGVMWTFEKVETETETVEQAAPAAPAPVRIPRRRKASCPVCGEEEGGMFHAGRCAECGFDENAPEEAVEEGAETIESPAAEQAIEHRAPARPARLRRRRMAHCPDCGERDGMKFRQGMCSACGFDWRTQTPPAPQNARSVRAEKRGPRAPRRGNRWEMAAHAAGASYGADGDIWDD